MSSSVMIRRRRRENLPKRSSQRKMSQEYRGGEVVFVGDSLLRRLVALRIKTGLQRLLASRRFRQGMFHITTWLDPPPRAKRGVRQADARTPERVGRCRSTRTGQDVPIEDDDDEEAPDGKKASKPATQSMASRKRKSQSTQGASSKSSRPKNATTSSPTAKATTCEGSSSKIGATGGAPGAKGKGKEKASEAPSPASESSGSGNPPPSQSVPPTPGEDIPATPTPPTSSSFASGDVGSPAGTHGTHVPAAGGKRVASAGASATSTSSTPGRGGSGAGASVAKTPKGGISDYMLRANRPYSCINVFDNLHKKIPKPMVQKILDELVGCETLRVQEYGKAKIYYANQDALPDGAGDVSESKLQKLEQEAKDLTTRLQIVSAEAREAQSRVQNLSSQPTDSALDEELAMIEEKVKRLEQRNGDIKGQGRTAVAGSMKQAKAEFNKYRGMWVTRKRNAMDVIDMIADGMEKKPKDIMEILGVEKDEESVPPRM